MKAQMREEMQDEVQVQVTGIINGDTFETSNPEHQVVHLCGVEAPERGKMEYGTIKLALIKFLRGKEVIIKPVARDAYDRTVAQVEMLDGTSVNDKVNDDIKKLAAQSMAS